MRLPQVNYKNKAQTFIQEFLGYNHNLRTQPGEFYDMENITMDHYPVISTRQGEVEFAAYSGNPNGLYEYAPGQLMAVCGNLLYVNITETTTGEIVSDSPEYLEDSEKSFATIGVYTVIMPDKVIYNASTGELSRIEQNFSGGEYGGQYLIMQVVPCDIEGESLTPVEQSSAPEDTTAYWYDTENNVYKRYSTTLETWIEVDSPYVKLIPRISADDSSYVDPDKASDKAMAEKARISEYFGSLKPLDAVSYVAEDHASDDNEDWFNFTVYGKGTEDETNYIILNRTDLKGIEPFSVRTRCPDIDHIVALNNRVWGVDNETHELFACALGDPTQWFNYAGVASDSYSVSLGNAEEITAAVAFNNYPHFFTETKIIKIYGDYPSNYQVHTTKADGVLSGASDTVQQVEGVLFYLSPIGVMAYDGSIPYFRGQQFAPNQLVGLSAVGGKDGTKYCLAVENEDGTGSMFAYDIKSGLWAKTDNKLYKKTAQLGNALCFLDGRSRLITCFDRTQNNDYVTDVAGNILSLENREEA